MFAGPRAQAAPCSRTPTRGLACKPHATSQRGPAAGAPGTARRRSWDGSSSSYWPSWSAGKVGTETLTHGAVRRRRVRPRRQDRQRRLPRPGRRDRARPEHEPRRPALQSSVPRSPTSPSASARSRASPRSAVHTARTAAGPSPPTAMRRWSASRSRATRTTPRSTTTIDATVAAVEGRRRRRTPSFASSSSGEGSSDEEFKEVFDADLQKAGTQLAADHPADPAASRSARWWRRASRCCWRSPASSRTMGLVGPLSHVDPVEESINHVILLIGLAVGVDYALFYLRRVREERAAGRGKPKPRSRRPRRPPAARCWSPASR